MATASGPRSISLSRHRGGASCIEESAHLTSKMLLSTFCSIAGTSQGGAGFFGREHFNDSLSSLALQLLRLAACIVFGPRSATVPPELRVLGCRFPPVHANLATSSTQPRECRSPPSPRVSLHWSASLKVKAKSVNSLTLSLSLLPPHVRRAKPFRARTRTGGGGGAAVNGETCEERPRRCNKNPLNLYLLLACLGYEPP